MRPAKPKREISRLAAKDVVRVGVFTPWWVRCSRCSHLAYMTPMLPERKADCKCGACGAIYSISLSANYSTFYTKLPLWLRVDFRDTVFWALNNDHLDYLERVIRATLRERPVLIPISGHETSVIRSRAMTNQNMPFNLPAWLLSAKNRPDLLKLIVKLRKTVPS